MYSVVSRAMSPGMNSDNTLSDGSTPTATPIAAPAQKPKVVIDDFVRYLLSNSPHTPCALIANVYDEIVTQDKRFQIALEVVLPCLASRNPVSYNILSV